MLNEWEEIKITVFTLRRNKGNEYAATRGAKITLRDGKFDKCEYDGLNSYKQYTYEDWMFLLEVAQKIKELQNEK